MITLSFFKNNNKQYSPKRILVVSLLVIFLIFIEWGLHKAEEPSVFSIKSVDVRGNFEHLTKAQIQAVMAPFLSQGFFGVSLSKIRAALMSLPWVDAATVTRAWPDKIVIQLVEKKPVATWNGSLLSSSGLVFSVPNQKSIQGLPVLTGPPDQLATVFQYFQQFNQMLSPLNLNIVSLEMLSPDNFVQMVLNNGMQVVVGENQLVPRVQQFVTMFPKVFNNPKESAKVVDLRYTKGLAVEWMKGETFGAKAKVEKS